MDEQVTQNGVIEQTNVSGEEQSSLETYIDSSKQSWIKIINDMNKKFASLDSLRSLQGELYSQRQIAVEYNNELLNKISVLNKRYRSDCAAKYNYYRTQSNVFYKSDSAINNQVSADLSAIIYKIELMSNFSEFMKETIKTIDDMIYGIQHRIRLEELIIGAK